MRIFNRFIIYSFILLAAGLISTADTAQAQPGARVSMQTFYEELAPHGRWIKYKKYGRVWQPRVEEDFQPYGTNGHWVVTQYGNTWVSDYEWGWAPFHYGRWIYDDYYGWMWLPDDEWAPAWVNWRSGDGYYGWAPLGPGMSVNININIPLTHWIFVPRRYIAYSSVYDYRAPRGYYTNIYNQTTVINNIYVTGNNNRYFYGPRTREIERYTGRPVRVYNVRDAGRPGRSQLSDNDLRVYRPGSSRSESDMSNSRYTRTERSGATSSRGNSTDRSVERNTARSSVERGSGAYERPSRMERPERPERFSGNGPERIAPERAERRTSERTNTGERRTPSLGERPQRMERPSAPSPVYRPTPGASSRSTAVERPQAPVAPPARRERMERPSTPQRDNSRMERPAERPARTQRADRSI